MTYKTEIRPPRPSRRKDSIFLLLTHENVEKKLEIALVYFLSAF